MPNNLPPLGRRVLIKRMTPADFSTGLIGYHTEIASRQPIGATAVSASVDSSEVWAWLTDQGYWLKPEEVEKWAELPKL